MPGARIPVFLLDVSRLDYEDRLTASSLQGLANRDGRRLFLDHGRYDEPGSRRTKHRSHDRGELAREVPAVPLAQ